MKTDPLIARHRDAEALSRAYDAAVYRGDSQTVARLRPRMWDAIALAAETPPESNQGAALVLLNLAKLARDDAAYDGGGPASRTIARTAARVADAVARGAYDGWHLADLRALLPLAERIDDEICAGAVQSLEHALSWLARPKLAYAVAAAN